MTDLQLYLTIGLPVLAVLVGILANGTQINVLSARMTSVEGRMGTLETRMDSRFTAMENRLDSRFSALEAKIDTKFDLLVGKVVEIDNRLTRLEERLKH